MKIEELEKLIETEEFKKEFSAQRYRHRRIWVGDFDGDNTETGYIGITTTWNEFLDCSNYFWWLGEMIPVVAEF